MADIFISYARQDRDAAERLARALEKYGWSVFWDTHIPTGQRFDAFISEQLSICRCVVVLWSRWANCSEWVIEEAAEGRNRGILVPTLIEAVEPPFGFRHRNAADLISWTGSENHRGFQKLIQDVYSLLAQNVEKTPIEVLYNQHDGFHKSLRTESTGCGALAIFIGALALVLAAFIGTLCKATGYGCPPPRFLSSKAL